MLRLSELWIYPIKSIPGIRMQEAKVMERGFEFDRRWMLIDATHTFLSQRTFPELALLDLKITDDSLQIIKRSNPSEKIETPLFPDLLEEIEVNIWNDKVLAWTVDPAADVWLSEFMGQPVKLVYMGDQAERQIDLRFSKDGENVSFADGYPYLLISEASLADLNGRLAEPVSMRRFRPNLIVTGASAFDEDTWKNFQIGNISFRGVKTCARCTVITIDPQTAEKGAEPLKTLSAYRTENNRILFGQNLIADHPGILRQGDGIVIGH
jgi:uncharacterized protein YcbX